MFKKILLLLSLLIATQAWGATLYFNGATNGDWNTLSNWWTNSGFTIPANSLPGITDDVIAVAATISSNSGGPASVNSFTFNDASLNPQFISINLTVANGATFNHSTRNNGTINGTTTFNNGGSNNGGTINGTTTFYNNGSNNGTINGTTTFNDDSYNNETINGTTTFNSGSSNNGPITGNATFNGSSFNGSLVTGNATFNGSSFNYGTITLNADVYFPSENPIGGTVQGTITYHGYDNVPPTILSVNSDKPNGSYTVGEVIDIDVTFSEAVTSTGNVTVTLETGVTDRTCTFTVTSATTGTCNYTVQLGDATSNLNVSSISGTIQDADLNTLVNFVPATNLSGGGLYQGNKDIDIFRTLYFNGATNAGWRVLTNWWADSGFTIPANSLPILTDNVIMSASVGSIPSGNYPADRLGLISNTYPSVNTLTFSGAGITFLPTIGVINGATFNGSSINGSNVTADGTIIGNATFNDSSENRGTITQNATFNDTSCNGGTVGGTVTFNDDASSRCSSDYYNSGSAIVATPDQLNAPVITSPSITRTGTTNTITFQTDEPSQGRIIFSGGAFPTLDNYEYRTEHVFSFTDGTLCNTYNYTITARDSNGNETTIPGPSLTTEGCPPELESLTISTENTTDTTSVTITFTTNRSTKYVLDYGLGTDLNLSTDDPTFETHRSVVLSSLSPCSEYSYRILAIDEEGISLLSSPESFTTSCPSLPERGIVYPISKEEPVEAPPANIPENPQEEAPVSTPEPAPQVSQPDPICGNSIIESGEVCDNGDLNGEEQCSWDCLLVINMPAQSTPTNDQSVKGSIISQTKQVITKVVQNTTKKEIKRSLMKTAEETTVVAQYSVTGVIILLGGLFIALNIMILGPAAWVAYTVAEGDTLSAIATRFNMVDSALLRKNPSLQLTGLTPGMILQVKNRPFLEKDYLDKLKDVLNVFAQRRKYVLPNNTPSVPSSNVPMQQV